MSAVPTPTHVEAPQSPLPAPPPLETRPSFPRKWLIALLLLAIAGFAAWQLAKRRPAEPAAVTPAIRTARVTTGTLEHTIRLAGQTSARNFANITAPRMFGGDSSRSAMVLLNLAKSGSIVKKGDVVVEIDNQWMKDHVDDTGDTVAAADADVRKRRAEHQIEWQNLEQTLRVAKAELDKAKLDYQAAEVRTDIERQLLKLSLDEAQARYDQSQRDLKFKKESQAADLRVLELTRERHARHLERDKLNLSRYTIHAPMPGLVVMATVFRGGEMPQIQQGDQVNSGQQIMKIVDPASMQVEAMVNQSESSLLRIGQPVTIRLDGFPEVLVPGHIYSIGALATRSWREQYYIRNIPVRVKFDTQDPRVIPDLSASVSVLLGKAENATIVPLSALQNEAGKTWAYVRSGQDFARREVQTGLGNDTHVVVTAGLSAGEEVRLN